MTNEQTALSHRAVACKNWRWVRGMLRQDDYRYVGSGVWARWSDVHSLTTALHSPDQWPDLTDAATLGCLLALVREAWDDEGAYAMPRSTSEGGGWALWACPPGEVNIWRGVGQTEAEALVAALESAP